MDRRGAEWGRHRDNVLKWIKIDENIKREDIGSDGVFHAVGHDGGQISPGGGPD